MHAPLISKMSAGWRSCPTFPRLVTSTTLAVVLWTLLTGVLNLAGKRCVAGKACHQRDTVHY